MEQPVNPERPTSETQAKDQLRSAQRTQLLSQIKDESIKQFLHAFIPSDKPLKVEHPEARKVYPDGISIPNGRFELEINPELKQNLDTIVDSLGENTHTFLFGLAATAKNPQELANIFVVLSQLDRTGKGDILAKSEDRFIKRRLSGNTNNSNNVKSEADQILYYLDSSSSPHMEGILAYFHLPDEYKIARPHLLESFLYIMSTKKISIDKKKPILKELYLLKAQFNIASLAANNPSSTTVFGPDVTFWKYVDGTWMDLNIGRSITTPLPDKYNEDKKIKIISGKNSPVKEGTKVVDDELIKARDRILELEDMVYRMRRGSLDLESQVSILTLENLELKERLRQSAQQPRSEPRQSARKSPLEVLGLPPTATSEQITKAYRQFMLSLHSDQVEGALKGTKLNPEAISAIKDLVKNRVQDVNAAMEQLRREGKVK